MPSTEGRSSGCRPARARHRRAGPRRAPGRRDPGVEPRTVRGKSVARQARGIVLRDRGRLDEGLAELPSRPPARAAFGRPGPRGRRPRNPGRDPGAVRPVRMRAWSSWAACRRRHGPDDPGSDPDAPGDYVLLLPRGTRTRRWSTWEGGPAAPAVGRRAGSGKRGTLNVLGLGLPGPGTGLRRRPAPSARPTTFFVREGQDVEAVITVHNRGLHRLLQRGLPAALCLYDGGGREVRRPGPGPQKLVSDRCDALLAAGLADEAAELVAARVRGRIAAARRARPS